VVAVVLVFLLMSRSKDGGAGGPEEAAARLLDASKSQDIGAAQAALCQRDLDDGFFTDQLSTIHVVSYSINNVSQEEGVSIVHASMETTEDDVTDAQIPVIQEGGDWKVCFASLGDPLDTPDTDPTIPDLLQRPG
jgi:hypothetical protein